METIALDFIKESVLVSSGCYNKYHRRGGLNNKPLFLTVLEAEKSKTKVPADLVLGDSPIWFPSLCTHMTSLYACRERALVYLPLLIMTLIPLWGSTLMTLFKPKYFPEPQSPNTIILEVRDSTYESQKGHKHSVHNRILGTNRCGSKDSQH